MKKFSLLASTLAATLVVSLAGPALAATSATTKDPAGDATKRGKPSAAQVKAADIISTTVRADRNKRHIVLSTRVRGRAGAKFESVGWDYTFGQTTYGVWMTRRASAGWSLHVNPSARVCSSATGKHLKKKGVYRMTVPYSCLYSSTTGGKLTLFQASAYRAYDRAGIKAKKVVNDYNSNGMTIRVPKPR